jgi:hypothetical protein
VQIEIQVLETTPGEIRSAALFTDPKARPGRPDLGEAYPAIVSHLAETLGSERVFQAALMEERFPEKSWKRSRPHFKNGLSSGLAAALTPPVPNRPTRLLRQPKKIEVTREKIFLPKKSYTILDWSQVERLSGHWLDHPEFKAEERNYYQVRIAEGPVLWVFEDPLHQFFLHGWFE